jgi:molybdopterin-guanine dinucleotide biosynthesis protein A
MGINKLDLMLGGETLLASAVRRFSSFDNVYLSVRDGGRAVPGTIRIADIYPDCGPMSGLHAALTRTQEDGVFLVAADMPFADADTAKVIISLAGDCDAAAIGYDDGRVEPLFAYYKKTLLPEITRSLDTGDYRMSALLRRVNARIISVTELGDKWSAGQTSNINTPADYEKVRENKGE